LYRGSYNDRNHDIGDVVRSICFTSTSQDITTAHRFTICKGTPTLYVITVKKGSTNLCSFGSSMESEVLLNYGTQLTITDKKTIKLAPPDKRELVDYTIYFADYSSELDRSQHWKTSEINTDAIDKKYPLRIINMFLYRMDLGSEDDS